jgi:hypothetical protein
LRKSLTSAYGALVASLGGSLHDAALTGNECLVAIEQLQEGVPGIAAQCFFAHLRYLQIYAIAALGHTAELQNTLGHLVHLVGYVIVEFLILGVQDEELWSGNIPVEAPQIGVKHLEVSQQHRQPLNHTLYFLLV